MPPTKYIPNIEPGSPRQGSTFGCGGNEYSCNGEFILVSVNDKKHNTLVWESS